MVVAIVPQSTVGGPESDYTQLPMAMFKLFIVDNEDVISCSNNKLTLLSETENGQRGELVYTILTDAEKSMNGGSELLFDIPALKV
jgi:hypothetical protein